MKKTFKLIAAALAAVTAMSCAAVNASAQKVDDYGGKMYVYSDSGEPVKPYTGWKNTESGGKTYRSYYKNGVMLRSKWLKSKGKRTYFLKKDGTAATGDVKIGSVNYCFGEDGKLIYGVKYTASDVTDCGMTLNFCGVALNDPDIDLIGGESYYLVREKSNGKWVKVPVTFEGEYGFNDLGYMFFDDAGNVCEQQLNINWEWLYGKLPEGRYRLVTNYVYKADRNDYSKPVEQKKVYVTFRISERNSNIGEFDVDFKVTKKSATGIEFNASRSGAYKGEVSWDFYCYEIEKSTGSDPELDWVLYNDMSLMNAATCEAYDIEGDTNPFSLSWTSSYGSLPAGSYRIHLVLGNNYAKKDFYIPFKVTKAEAAKTADLIKTVPDVTYTKFVEPPTLNVTVGGKTYTACTGTYSWDNEVPGSDYGQSVEADSEGALHSKNWMPLIDVKAGQKVTLSTSYGLAPDEVWVHCWDEKYWEDYSAYDKYETVDVKDMTFTPKKGGNIYEVFCNWGSFEEQGITVGGNCRYSFFIKVV